MLTLTECLASSGEDVLISLAKCLGAESYGGPLSTGETSLLREAGVVRLPEHLLGELRAAIRDGDDPLGDALLAARSQVARRTTGCFYTSSQLVEPIVAWLLKERPNRVIDAGTGSGRFSIAVARQAPFTPIVAVDIDPVATILLRASLAVLQVGSVNVRNEDFLTFTAPPTSGVTAFVANPPYVRNINGSLPGAMDLRRRLGLAGVGRSGLHAYFLMAVALQASRSDVGVFLTSAEWIDTAYGREMRDLLTGRLQLTSIHSLSPESRPFASAATTAMITTFRADDRNTSGSVIVRTVPRDSSVSSLKSGAALPRTTFRNATRWGPLVRGTRAGIVEVNSRIGDHFRVRRGIATGDNGFFVLSAERASTLGLTEYCVPVVSRARQVVESRGRLQVIDSTPLLLSIPRDINRPDHPALDAYLRARETSPGGPHERALTRDRSPWWRVPTPPPAPIVATYMRRQPPFFAFNDSQLLNLNVAHGLYPREPMSVDTLRLVVDHLNDSRDEFAGLGRVYFGGLEKFEPSEMESLPVPESLARLLAAARNGY